MHVNRNLNLVIPIQRNDEVLYVHAAPLSRTVFENHFLLISKTFNSIYTEGLSYTTGPRVSCLLMKQIGVQSGMSDKVTELMNELRRTSSFIGPDRQPVPLQGALDSGLLTEWEVSEVENALTFFIVASAMHLQKEVEAILKGAGKLWNASPTSLNCTEFASTLLTSTATETGGVTVTI